MTTLLRRTALAVITAATAALLASATAAAAPVYRFNVDASNIYGSFVDRLDPAKSTTVRVMRGAAQQTRTDLGNNRTSAGFSWPFQPGDVIEVYQPQADNPPLPGQNPVETFTVPAVSVAGSAGSPTITGTAPDGDSVSVEVSMACGTPSDAVTATRSPGAFTATYPVPLIGQSLLHAVITQPDGDIVRTVGRVPGDGPCFYIRAARSFFLLNEEDPSPYAVYANALDLSAIPTTRTVLRRNGAIFAEDDEDDIQLTSDLKPLAGDVVEVYRPSGALTPAHTITIPPHGSVFDADADLVAVDAPDSVWVEASACRAGSACLLSSWRTAGGTPAGRTFLSFKMAGGWNAAYDLHADDYVVAGFQTPDGRLQMSFDAVPGDLTPPVGSIRLGKKLKARKISKSFKVKFRSNEAGSVTAKLTTAKMPKAAARRPLTLATGKRSVKPGTNTLTMKLGKNGKKAFKRIKSSRRNTKATLTLTLKDASGNVTTVVKHLTIVR